MNPTPPALPPWICGDCGATNEAWRRKCRNCGAQSATQSQDELIARRICRTPEQAFACGWEDGADDPPLTDEQRTRLAALLAPYVRPIQEAA